MFDFIENLMDVFFHQGAEKPGGEAAQKKNTYDKDTSKPIIKCSICTGEQVAGFKDIHTGKFEEVMLIREQKDLDDFMKQYGISEISKEY